MPSTETLRHSIELPALSGALGKQVVSATHRVRRAVAFAHALHRVELLCSQSNASEPYEVVPAEQMHERIVARSLIADESLLRKDSP